jgi:hypothetical protein
MFKPFKDPYCHALILICAHPSIPCIDVAFDSCLRVMLCIGCHGMCGVAGVLEYSPKHSKGIFACTASRGYVGADGGPFHVCPLNRYKDFDGTLSLLPPSSLPAPVRAQLWEEVCVGQSRP